MSLKKKLTLSIIIQSIGPLSQFLVPAVILLAQGVDAQGVFASAKNHLDLLLSFFIFGLPQGILIAQGKAEHRIDRHFIYWMAVIYVLLLFPFIYITSFWTIPHVFIEQQYYVVLIALSVAAISLREIWRGVYIQVNDSVRYAFYSILTSLVLAASLLIALLVGVSILDNISLLFFIGSVLTLVLSVLIYREPFCKSLSLTIKSFLPIFKNSLDGFIQGLLLVLQPYLFYKLIGSQVSDSLAIIGFVSIGFLLIQGIMTPLQMISPIIMKRWMGILHTQVLVNDLKKFAKIGIFLALVAYCLGLLMYLSADFVIFNGYKKEQLIAALFFMLSIPATYFFRLTIMVCTSHFFLKANILSGFIKLVTSISFFLILTALVPEMSLVIAVAIAFMVGEYWAALVGIICSKVLCRISFKNFLLPF